jgi:excisionase family DNA binding protein
MKNLNINLSSQLLTRKEAAEVLGCKENTLAVWATNKRYNLPFYKIGRLVKYKLSDLENFVLNNQRGGSFEC